MSVSSSNRLLCDENTHSNSSAYVSVEHNTKNIAMETKVSDNLMVGQQYPVKGHKNTMRSYRRLKFFFTMMLLLNALLLMVVIICMLLIVPHMSTMNNKQEPQPTPMPQSPHMKCLSIQTKLNRLYRNGQMVDKVNDDEECSMEDLMDSFIQHVEESMKKEKSNNSSAFHLVSNNTDVTRCKDSRTLFCLKNWKLSINTTKISINDDSITVPSSGAYFLYSRVVINAKIGNNMKDTDMITHLIRYSNTGHQFNDLETSSIRCGVIKDTMTHISYIEKIQYLEKGSFIKIALDFPRDVSMHPSISAGVFGMFKL